MENRIVLGWSTWFPLHHPSFFSHILSLFPFFFLFTKILHLCKFLFFLYWKNFKGNLWIPYLLGTIMIGDTVLKKTNWNQHLIRESSMQNSIFTPKIKVITNENVEVQRLSYFLLMANNIKFCKDRTNNVCFLTRILSFISSYTYVLLQVY